ncbi:MAG: quinate 5-dehydrogenase, partial [Clostridia bacterium]|nr:quinate 5-dehydrogenase [Clostridia bacterium]
MCKHIVSVSLGASARNATGNIQLCGETYQIIREGHDGDINAMRTRLLELDGTVDAIGMGGCSCYLYGRGGRKYPLRAICKLAS